MFYSGTLALYFLFLIRFEKKEPWIARYIEPFGHILAFLYPLTSGIIGLLYEGFNPLPVLPGWCWFNEYPQGCSDDETVECTRGIFPNGVSWLAGGLHTFALIFSIIVVSMVIIVLRVRATEKRLARYAGGQDQHFERTKATATQALLYILAFLFTYVPIAGTQFSRERAANFAFALLVKTLSTLQGFFNSFIFLRKRFRALTAEGEPLHFLRSLASGRYPSERRERNDDGIAIGSIDEPNRVHRTHAKAGESAVEGEATKPAKREEPTADSFNEDALVAD